MSPGEDNNFLKKPEPYIQLYNESEQKRYGKNQPFSISQENFVRNSNLHHCLQPLPTSLPSGRKQM